MGKHRKIRLKEWCGLHDGITNGVPPIWRELGEETTKEERRKRENKNKKKPHRTTQQNTTHRPQGKPTTTEKAQHSQENKTQANHDHTTQPRTPNNTERRESEDPVDLNVLPVLKRVCNLSKQTQSRTRADKSCIRIPTNNLDTVANQP